MTCATIQDLVDSTTLINMNWKSVTFGSLIYTNGKWYLFLESNHMIRINKGYSWDPVRLSDVNNVQCLCDMAGNPISFFREFQSMLLELLNTGKSPR